MRCLIIKEKKEMEKYRVKSWYWGNYCVQLENGTWIDNNNTIISNKNNYFNLEDLEPYNEEEHGWHNSEEYQRGEKQWK